LFQGNNLERFLKSKTLVLLLAVGTLSGFACSAGTTNENAVSSRPGASSNTSTEAAPAPAPRTPKAIDVPKLADKTIADFDAAFGRPDESKPIPNNGEYRLYKVNGHSRGLAVRFFNGRAKEFNLILDRPIPTAREAIKVVFNIDVGNVNALNDAKEPLSESFRGTFDGIRFSKVSAKKQESGNGFIFVLAQVAK
jgi:hypothetical protein